MKLSLKNHPFAVETKFETSLVLTYALPKEQLQELIPECLELDTFQDKWAFVAVALVDTRSLRPKGFPEMLGNDFVLAGFRVFVRFTNEKGKRLRGLYILKSETNKAKMALFGNLFTHYNYTSTDIEFTETENKIHVLSEKSGLDISIEIKNENVELPKSSPFGNCNEARRYAGPLPFTFTYNKETKEVLIIEGVRQNWKPEPVTVLNEKVSFLKSKIEFENAILANAFIIKNIPYHWKKGKLELWKQREENFKVS